MADIINPMSPMEMQVQQQAIDRQRQLALALQQQSLQSPEGQMVSGRYVAPSPTQYLSKLAQGLIGKEQQSALDQKQLGLAKQYNDSLLSMARTLINGGQQPGVSAASSPQVTTAAQTNASPDSSTVMLPEQDGTVSAFKKPLDYQAPTATTPQPAAPAPAPQAPTQPTAQASGNSMFKDVNENALARFFNNPNDPFGKLAQLQIENNLKNMQDTELAKDVRLLPPEQRQAAINAKLLPPIVNRGFGVLTYGKDGQLQNDPASMAGIEQAKGIEGRYGAPISLKMPNGSEIQLSPTEFAEFQKNGGRLPLRFLPTQVQDAIQQDTNRTGSPANINITTPQGTVSGQMQPSSPGQIGISQSTLAKEEQAGYGKNLADYQKEIDEKANAAQVVKARIGEMRDFTKGFTSGSLTPYKEKLGGVLIGLGADADAVNAKLGNISDMQAFNKEALNMAFDMTKQLTSRPAAQEVMLALKANPNLALQPDASRKIMNTIEGMADYNLAKQQATGEWRRTHNNSLEGFEAAWNKANPIKNYIDFAALQAGGGKNQPNQPAQVDYQQLYGIKLK